MVIPHSTSLRHMGALWFSISYSNIEAIRTSETLSEISIHRLTVPHSSALLIIRCFLLESTQSGQTPLHKSVAVSSLRLTGTLRETTMYDCLLYHQADIDSKDDVSLCFPFYCVRGFFLLPHIAIVVASMPMQSGSTPLLLLLLRDAEEYSDFPIDRADFLLESGADPDAASVCSVPNTPFPTFFHRPR